MTFGWHVYMYRETNCYSQRAGKVNQVLFEPFCLDSLPPLSLSLCTQFHFLVHSYGNRGQEMRGFSRSMWNLAFCVATAQAAATEARGEIEFSWNSPVSLALGWAVLDLTGLGAGCNTQLCVCPEFLGVTGCWLGKCEAEPRLKGTMSSLACHYGLIGRFMNTTKTCGSEATSSSSAPVSVY